MRVVPLLILLCCAYVNQADEDSLARLLASKNILNLYLVAGHDLTVEYKIFNIGNSAAIDVKLKDSSFPDEDFKVVRGSLDVQWDRISPGTNVSHAVILKPNKFGYYNFTAAEIDYLTFEDSIERQYAYTSAPGEGAIFNQKDFDRRFSPHVLDWAVFAVMTLPSLGIPFLLWYSSKRKYDTPKSKKS